MAGMLPTRASYEDAVYRGAALTKRDVVALREAQLQRPRVVLNPKEEVNAQAQRIAKLVRAKDEKINCLQREVESIDDVFVQAHERRKALAKVIEEKHQYVLEEIQKARQHVTQDAHRRHKELKQFKVKFDAAVEQSHVEFISEVDMRGDEVEEHIRNIDTHLDTIKEDLKQETIDREANISRGTDEMVAELNELEAALGVQRLTRERAEQRLQSELDDGRLRALERMEVEAVDREKVLKKHHNDIQKECKRLNSEETKSDQQAETVIDKIGVTITKEETVREACSAKLVANLRRFLDEFEHAIEEENAEKWKAIELMREAMRETRAA